MYTYLNLYEIEGFTELDNESMEDYKLYFLSLSIEYKGTLRKLCQYFNKSINVQFGCGIAMFKHLLITKKIHVDIFNNFSFDKHIDISIVKDECKMESVM